MRLLVPALPLFLVACGGEAQQDARRGEAIECSIGGAAFERSCTLETRAADGALAVTVRNARGGFRRFLVPADGSGAIVADGAERLAIDVLGDGRVELSVGGDRYRVPERLSPPASRP